MKELVKMTEKTKTDSQTSQEETSEGVTITLSPEVVTMLRELHTSAVKADTATRAVVEMAKTLAMEDPEMLEELNAALKWLYALSNDDLSNAVHSLVAAVHRALKAREEDPAAMLVKLLRGKSGVGFDL